MSVAERWLRPSLERDAARELLTKKNRSWRRFFARRFRRSQAPRRTSAHWELVWLPYWRVDIRLERTVPATASAPSIARRTLSCLVCATTGLGHRIDASEATFQAMPCEFAAPRLHVDRDQALLVARRLCVDSLLLSRSRRLQPTSEVCDERWYHPYWIAIAPTRADITSTLKAPLTLEVVDSVTGKRAVRSTKMAVLEHLVDSHGTVEPTQREVG